MSHHAFIWGCHTHTMGAHESRSKNSFKDLLMLFFFFHQRKRLYARCQTWQRAPLPMKSFCQPYDWFLKWVFVYWEVLHPSVLCIPIVTLLLLLKGGSGLRYIDGKLLANCFQFEMLTQVCVCVFFSPHTQNLTSVATSLLWSSTKAWSGMSAVGHLST